MDTIQGKAKLDAAIQANVAKAGAVVDRVMRDVPTDSIVKASAVRWQATEDHGLLMGVENMHPIHQHAMRQVGAIAGIPGTYVDTLGGGAMWQRELLAHNLRETYARSSSRHLVRAVGGEVRGFLSDRYRRLDSRPLLEAFVEGVQRFGAVPFSGHAGDVRVSLKAIVPDAMTIGRDVVAMGIEWSNSDFGSGTHSVRAFLLRLTCLNGATVEDVMRNVHLGGRLADDVEYSRKTYELDTRTTVSALRDVVKGVLEPAKRQGLAARIEKAQATEANWTGLKSRLAKALTKEELRKADEAFNGPDEVNLPPEPTLWRASNAISWIAHTAGTDERKLELEKLAGGLLTGKVVAEAA